MVHANPNPLIEKTAEKYAFSYAFWLLTTQEMKHTKKNSEFGSHITTTCINYKLWPRVITGGPSGSAWGMSWHSPLPLKHQPWYTHCNLPHWSILPSDKGANLWGQASSWTCQAPSFLSHHTTTSIPNTLFPCGFLLSRSQIGIKGYQWEYQSNFSAWLSNSGSASSGWLLLDSVNGGGDKAVKSLDFEAPLRTNETGEATWLLKNIDFLNEFGVSCAVGMWSVPTEKAYTASMFLSAIQKEQECTRREESGNTQWTMLRLKTRGSRFNVLCSFLCDAEIQREVHVLPVVTINQVILAW